MSDIYNIFTGIAEFALISVILWQKAIINKLVRYIKEMENAEDNTDTDCHIGDNQLHIHRPHSDTE